MVTCCRSCAWPLTLRLSLEPQAATVGEAIPRGWFTRRFSCTLLDLFSFLLSLVHACTCMRVRSQGRTRQNSASLYGKPGETWWYGGPRTHARTRRGTWGLGGCVAALLGESDWQDGTDGKYACSRISRCQAGHARRRRQRSTCPGERDKLARRWRDWKWRRGSAVRLWRRGRPHFAFAANVNALGRRQAAGGTVCAAAHMRQALSQLVRLLASSQLHRAAVVCGSVAWGDPGHAGELAGYLARFGTVTAVDAVVPHLLARDRRRDCRSDPRVSPSPRVYLSHVPVGFLTG